MLVFRKELYRITPIVCVYYSHLLNSGFSAIPQESTENEIQWKNWCKCLQLCISYYKTATIWKCSFFYLKYLKKHVIIILINWLRLKQLSLKNTSRRPSCSFWDFMPFFPLLLSSELLVYLVASLLCPISHFSIGFIGFIPSLKAFFLSIIAPTWSQALAVAQCCIPGLPVHISPFTFQVVATSSSFMWLK